MVVDLLFLFFFKQKTAYEVRISDWSSDVCSSDLDGGDVRQQVAPEVLPRGQAARAAGEHEVAVEHAAQLRARDAGDVDAEADADGPDHDPQRPDRKSVV